MKVFAVNIFARWEFDRYKLFFKEEDAIKYSDDHNSELNDKCTNEKCCFARVEDVEVIK